MRTRDFLAINIGAEREKSFSSVFVDSHGVAYSYGYHYPLAAIIDGVGFVNTRGYSITTAKHIAWAYSALQSRINSVYGVPMRNGESMTLEGVRAAALVELAHLEQVMSTKKRHDTFIYQDLERQSANMSEILSVTADSALSGGINRHESEMQRLKTISAVMALGDIFGSNQSESNDWKARMLRAGLDGRGLIMPDDWNELDEDTKTARLNAVIEQLGE